MTISTLKRRVQPKIKTVIIYTPHDEQYGNEQHAQRRCAENEVN